MAYEWEGWVTHSQYRKVLLQGHVALESHELADRARLASTENVYIFSEAAAESILVEIFKRQDVNRRVF